MATSPAVEVATVHATSFRTARRTSAAQSSLEQLHSREGHKPAEQAAPVPGLMPTMSRAFGAGLRTNFGPSAFGSKEPSGSSPETERKAATLGYARPRFSRSPSMPVASQVFAPLEPAFPADLVSMLDGEHHTDELCTRFEVGLPMLMKWLAAAGGGHGEGDFGQVAIIYR